MVDWASQAYCNFTIFVGVVMFVISATQVSLSVTMITLITMISVIMITLITMISRSTG